MQIVLDSNINLRDLRFGGTTFRALLDSLTGLSCRKLVQTREAIAAHKAAAASPVGFSREAVDVAEANRVALWVISDAQWEIIIGPKTGAVRRRLPLAVSAVSSFVPV
jgi:hypothetical protein